MQTDNRTVRQSETQTKDRKHTHSQSDRQSVGQANEEPDFDQGQSDLDQGRSDRRTDRQDMLLTSNARLKDWQTCQPVDVSSSLHRHT